MTYDSQSIKTKGSHKTTATKKPNLNQTLKRTISVKKRRDDESEEEDQQLLVQLHHDLDRYKTVNQELKWELDNEIKRANTLQSELGVAVTGLRNAEESHKIEIKQLQADNMKAISERKTLLEKLQQIEVVEDAIRKLYVQTKSRLAYEALTEEEEDKQIQELQQENILHTVGKLNGELVQLWIFKSELEEDLRARRKIQADQDQTRVLEIQAKMKKLAEEKLNAQQQVSKAIDEKEKIDQARKACLQEGQSSLHQMQIQMDDLFQQLKESEEKNQSLHSKLCQSREEGKKRDKIILHNRRLESQRHFDRQAMDLELRSLQNLHEKQMRNLQHQLWEVEKIKGENEQLQEEVQNLKRYICSVTRSYNIARQEELEKQLNAFRNRYYLKEKENQKLEQKVRNLTGKLELEEKQQSYQSRILGWHPSKDVLQLSKKKLSVQELEGVAEKNKLKDVRTLRRSSVMILRDVKQRLNSYPFNKVKEEEEVVEDEENADNNETGSVQKSALSVTTIDSRLQ